MAKEQDMKSLSHWIFEDESGQIDEEQLKKIQDSCPGTPEHFRDLVQDAVRIQMAEAGLEEMDFPKRTGESARGIRKRSTVTRRSWGKVWLVAAAVLAVGGIAAAAGNSWLTNHLMQQGVSEEDAIVLLETEPQQQVSELTGGGKTVEKNWSEPLLTVDEAYYDGSTLCFLAEPSEEAQDYDLALKDHASVNGMDGMTSLEKLDGEDAYFGKIHVMDHEDADEILQSDTVEVTMTVLAFPRYDGRILYTWKDADVYEEIYGTGAFTFADGVKCYAVTASDYYAGYTPHKLTMQIQLTENAKQVIEKYRKEGKLGEDDAAVIVGDEQSAAEETEKMSDSAEVPFLVVTEGSHVSCELSGSEGELSIDAEIVRNADQVYIGTLRADAVSEEALKALYSQGISENWTYAEAEDGEGTWKYQDQNIFVTADMETAHYQNDECGENEPDDQSEEDLIGLYQQALTSFGMEGQIEENTSMEYGTVKVYTAQLLLNGLPLAWNSQWNCTSTAQFENGQLESLNIPGVLTVTEQEEATLLTVDELMEHVAAYVKSGDIRSVPNGQPVTELSLEYYVDLTKQGLVFRPIWNFKVPYLDEGDAGFGAANYLYFDAVTGALIRDAYGW